jgi:23S rRNA U2552 (ribose-2'-O)-methylase RlmE/FtsJ
MSLAAPTAKQKPWELIQCVALPKKVPLPFMQPVQEGWKEQEHRALTEMKNRIEDLESADEWELRKKVTNPYESIFSGGDDAAFPSLAKVKPLSRSFFKMVEMLQVFDFWKYAKFLDDTKVTPISTGHLCEGPGGFLQCVAEGLKSRDLPVNKLYAITLRPTKHQIPGWRRSAHVLRKHPEISLQFGKDDTGDMLSVENQDHFIQQVGGPGSLHLVTADGGFDFSVDFSKQEFHAFPLILASFIVGLQALAPGGFLIIKLFDIYSQASRDLVLGSAYFFKDFCLYKPATSRPCNSERYFVARGYAGHQVAAKWIANLKLAAKLHTTNSPLTQLVKGNWPLAFTDLVQEQMDWQEDEQIKNIKETLELNKSDIEMKMRQNLQSSKAWCQTFKIPSS